MSNVRNRPERGRYEIESDGETAGFAEYREGEGEISFLHTEVEERFEGRGLAGELIGFALEDAKQRGLAVLPYCPFVRGYLERHPEYVELVPAGERERFGL